MVDNFWKWFKKELYRNFFKYIGTPTSQLLGPDTAGLLGMLAMFGGFFGMLFASSQLIRPIMDATGLHPILVAAPFSLASVAWMMFWMGASFWREDRD